MATEVTAAQLDGLFKEAYGDKVENLIPDASKFTKKYRFVPDSQEEGEKFNQPVVLSQEHGVTYAEVSDGAFDLEEAVAMTVKNAEINGREMLLRTKIPYNVAAKASNSKKAFVKATELIVENMMESITKRLEIAMLYGQSSVGIGQADGSTNSSSTVTVVDIDADYWAVGIWAGLENCKVDVYNGASQINTNATCVVDSVDLDNKQITISGNSTDIAAIDTQLGSGTAQFYFRGAYSKEMAGFDKIITNTGSLFGINAGTYNLWKGNVHTVSAAVAIGKILQGISKAAGRGLNEEADLWISPIQFEELNDDLAALRTFDTSFKSSRLEVGAESIAYHSQSGRLNIMPYNIVMDSHAFLIPARRVKRVGAQDVSFKTPGEGDKIFRHLSDKAGYELRVYTNQAVMAETPARFVKYADLTIP